MSVQAAHRLGTAEYGELVVRVQDAVSAALPAGAAVLVLSKGDPALIAIPGLAAAHFPQDACGEYAGHHPRDSEDAIAQLESLRRSGAEYLVIPATSLWWLDHYAGFAEHLARGGPAVADAPGTCRIFDLGSSVVTGSAREVPTHGSPEQLRDYLEHLLSPDARVLVLEGSPGLAAALAPLHAAAVSTLALRDEEEGATEVLSRLTGGGAEHLVVPRELDAWFDAHADVCAVLEGGGCKIADQRHLCRVFELKGPRVQA